MDEEYTVRVSVLDAGGNEVFELTTTPAKREDIFLAGHETPGCDPVLDYLKNVTAKLW